MPGAKSKCSLNISNFYSLSHNGPMRLIILTFKKSKMRLRKLKDLQNVTMLAVVLLKHELKPNFKS